MPVPGVGPGLGDDKVRRRAGVTDALRQAAEVVIPDDEVLAQRIRHLHMLVLTAQLGLGCGGYLRHNQDYCGSKNGTRPTRG